MADERVSDADVAELIALVDESTSAFISGNIRRYVELVDAADDFTLMPPEGGETVRGFDPSEENIAGMEAFFKSGDGRLEVVETYASGNLAVIVAVERQTGVVGDHPEQDLSLRVTLVFRREGPRWRLVHRHADSLVHQITIDHVLELARGEAAAAPGR
jgi:ketosteroid isomerase-like protein